MTQTPTILLTGLDCSNSMKIDDSEQHIGPLEGKIEYTPPPKMEQSTNKFNFHAHAAMLFHRRT